MKAMLHLQSIERDMERFPRVGAFEFFPGARALRSARQMLGKVRAMQAGDLAQAHSTVVRVVEDLVKSGGMFQFTESQVDDLQVEIAENHHLPEFVFDEVMRGADALLGDLGEVTQYLSTIASYMGRRLR